MVSTYWAVLHNGFAVVLKAVTVDDSDTTRVLEKSGVMLIPVQDHLVCQTCPHLGKCMDSHWVEGRFYGPSLTDNNLSLVSVCAHCKQTILSAADGFSETVPDQCPRVIFEGQNCPACENKVLSWEVN